MAMNLAKALPPGSQIYAHDAVEAPVDEFYASFSDAVLKCTSAREVTELSVGSVTTMLLGFLVYPGSTAFHLSFLLLFPSPVSSPAH